MPFLILKETSRASRSATLLTRQIWGSSTRTLTTTPPKCRWYLNHIITLKYILNKFSRLTFGCWQTAWRNEVVSLGTIVIRDDRAVAGSAYSLSRPPLWSSLLYYLPITSTNSWANPARFSSVTIPSIASNNDARESGNLFAQRTSSQLFDVPNPWKSPIPLPLHETEQSNWESRSRETQSSSLKARLTR